MARILLLALGLMLGGCGFQLRGAVDLPFSTLYVSGPAAQLAPELARALRTGSGVKIVNTSKEAEATLDVFGEEREKRILSLNASGRVSEFLLIYRVSFRLHDAKGVDLLPVQRIELKRDMSYSDTQVLAKEQEAVLLYQDMLNDAVQQVMRRLGAVKIGGHAG